MHVASLPSWLSAGNSFVAALVQPRPARPTHSEDDVEDPSSDHRGRGWGEPIVSCVRLSPEDRFCAQTPRRWDGPWVFGDSLPAERTGLEHEPGQDWCLDRGNAAAELSRGCAGEMMGVRVEGGLATADKD